MVVSIKTKDHTPKLYISIFFLNFFSFFFVGSIGFYPLQSGGKLVALAAALFGSFYMAMPLTIVGSKFYEIYEDVQEEDYQLEKQIAKIFQDVKKDVVTEEVGLSMTFHLKFLTKLKMHSTAAKSRIVEQSLSVKEVQMALEYITTAEMVCGIAFIIFLLMHFFYNFFYCIHF
jgi:hypothetical protein